MGTLCPLVATGEGGGAARCLGKGIETFQDKALPCAVLAEGCSMAGGGLIHWGPAESPEIMQPKRPEQLPKCQSFWPKCLRLGRWGGVGVDGGQGA